jgi:hypothetical protein
VAVDPTELLPGLDHPGGAPTQRHLPVAPASSATTRAVNWCRPVTHSHASGCAWQERTDVVDITSVVEEDEELAPGREAAVDAELSIHGWRDLLGLPTPTGEGLGRQGQCGLDVVCGTALCGQLAEPVHVDRPGSVDST